MTLTDSLRAAIRRHALQCYPEESCGLIVDGVYLPRSNCSATPTEAFNISPCDWAEAEDLGDVEAVVHSHPDGRAFPSGADFLAQGATGLPWVIVAVRREHSEGFYVFGA